MSTPYVPDETLAQSLQAQVNTPVYLYSERVLLEQAHALKQCPNAFGFTPRYAMKACPTAAVLKLFHKQGLHFDASSGYEVERLLRAGVPGAHISLSAQEWPDGIEALLEQGLLVNACSLHQLERYGQLRPGTSVGLRINPGLGSGHANRVNVGGPGSSFGLWHAAIPEALERATRFDLRIERIHTHIGSGTDPELWERAAAMTLSHVERVPDATSVNLGGGIKVARMPGEAHADLHATGERIAGLFRAFAERTGRELHLELEPGTFLVAQAGALLVRVQDVVDTGAEGYTFVKVDSGMTEILRPSHYGAQHPMHLLGAAERPQRAVVVVGHCCESGDLLTPQPGDPEALATVRLPEPRIGDLLVIAATGAYCASMSAKHYNSFPEAPEVLVHRDGVHWSVIRRRQRLEEIVQAEVDVQHDGVDRVEAVPAG